ncbi:MAG: EamA-like transporter family protein, partial [Pseudomonas sp.]
MPHALTLSVLLPMLIALLAGAAVPFQAGSNAALGRLLGHP